jgi:hypothetical protein
MLPRSARSTAFARTLLVDTVKADEIDCQMQFVRAAIGSDPLMEIL